MTGIIRHTGRAGRGRALWLVVGFWLMSVIVWAAPPAWAQQPAGSAGAQVAAGAAAPTGTNPLTPRDPGAASAMAQQISNEIYSPFCPGKTLEMCPSSGASEVRQHIQQMALDGVERQEIIETVIADIGEKYRIVAPPAQDNYMLLGLLVGAFVLFVLVVVVLTRRARAAGGGERDLEGAAEELSAEDRLYLEELRGEYLD